MAELFATNPNLHVPNSIKAYNISKITCIRVKINTRAQNHFIFNYYNRFYYYHIFVMNTPPYLNKMWAKITLVKYLMFHAVSYLNKMWAKITWSNTSCCIQHG